MAAPDTLNSVTARKLSSVITSLWAKIKATFQTIGNKVTSIRASSSASDDKYPSEKAVASAIESLDVSSVGGAGKYISAISEADGKISATATTMDTTPTANSTNAVTSGGVQEAIKDFRTKPQDISKGANLVVNGSGRMANNYNFSGFLYIPTIANGGSAGSFGFSGTVPTDEYISCDFNKKVVISADIKNLVAQPTSCTHRIAVYEYDIDKAKIPAPSIKFGTGTLTTLTQDLNPGDTVVHLADLSNANWLSATTHHRGFIFWNYKNSFGYLYPPETYSRNYYPYSDDSVLWEVANVNVAAGTITLNSAWTGPAIPAGTKVSRRNSGGLPYPASSNFYDTEWHSLKGAMKGVIAGGSSTQFSPPTAFIKVGLVPTNLSNTDEVTNKRAVVANFLVYEEQDINDGFGTLPVNRGGTGATTAIGAEYNILNQVADGTPSSLDDDRKIALCNLTKSASNGVFRWTKLSYFWTYFKDKISSVLGLTAASYGGNAATATTAQNYNTSSGTIKTALDGKRDIYGDFYGEGTSIYGWKIGRMALGTSGSANCYMTAIVRIDRWTKLDNGDRDFDSFFGVVKLWARNSSDGTTTWSKATIHSFKPTAFTSTARGYAIFKKSSNSGHTIDWYIGLAPDSDSTYTPKKEIAYSLIEISPMYEVNFTRGLERVSSDPGFDSWMDNCTREPWLAHDQYGAGSSSLPVYVNADNKVVAVDPKLTQGNLIRNLDAWTTINETDEYVPAANNSATAPYPHGRYSFARIWSWIKGKLTSDSGVDISGNAATASDAKSGSTLATTLSGKAPTSHASSSDTYGKGTESNYGHVKLDNSALSASSTNTDGVACGKGHTHSQYLTSHQSISGKMNTSADNAASGALQNLTAQLNEGTSDFTDGTELYTSYAGNSGFGTTGYVNTPYRRKASSMWNYINSKLVIERSPADVGTGHKRIQLGYGAYGSGRVGYCCYLVHIFFNFVGGTLAGKGVTVLVSYDWRETTYQSPKCQVLNDNFFSDTGYRIVLANFLSDNNTNLHLCLGLVNTSAPTTLVGFTYSYCKIMRVAYGLNWTESIASDNVGTYNYLVQSTYFMETDTNNKIKVVTALPSSPDSNTIYFV